MKKLLTTKTIVATRTLVITKTISLKKSLTTNENYDDNIPDDQNDRNILLGITGDLELKDYQVNGQDFDVDESGRLVTISCNEKSLEISSRLVFE